MPQPDIHVYTIDDIYRLPEGKRGELIGGKLYMMAPPSTRHQLILNQINLSIYNYIREKHGTCTVIPAPFAVFLKDEQNLECYVEPDISVVCDAGKLNEKGCNGAPDWIIEVVSPSSKSMDYGRKQALYLACGVKEYWIVDPLREIVVIYRASEDWSPSFYHFGEKLRCSLYEDFEITI